MLQVIPRLTGLLAGQATPCLSDFVTERSWLMLDLIANYTRWLNAAPAGWDADPGYNCASYVANMMLVVNDCTKRNIKQITDYTRFTGNVNGMLDNIIHVGEDHRSLIPNMNRQNLLNT